jgi:LssY C-terminus
LILFFCVSYLPPILACDQVPAGEDFRIRLLDPVSSYSSKTGASVRGILIESPRCAGVAVFPLGTLVEGQLKSRHKVGMGFRHETAALDLQFDRLSPKDAPPVAIQTTLMEVDNARELVKKGVVLGIRSTDTLQGIMTTRVIHLPAWNPYSYWTLAIRRLLFPSFPEPEIYLPPGTDLRLRLAAPLQVESRFSPVTADQEFAESDANSFDAKALLLPDRSRTAKGRDSDVVNLEFIGSREQVEKAFTAAGWNGSDPVSAQSVFRVFHAFISQSNYPRSPVSRQLLDGKPSDLVWEKSFDSYAKREHLRIWSAPDTWQGQPVWLGSAIRETGAVLSFRRMRFVHRLDIDLDAERRGVIRDLRVVGCVDAVHTASRPAMAGLSESATDDKMRTDGGMAVVQLKDCEPPAFGDTSPALAGRPRLRIVRYFRMQVLSLRSDLWRSNSLYGAFDLTRATVRAIRSSHSRDKSLQDLF